MVELCTNRYAKLRTGNRGQKTEMTGKSLRRRRSTLIRRVTEEEEEEDGDE
jgi:hypothetical protein